MLCIGYVNAQVGQALLMVQWWTLYQWFPDNLQYIYVAYQVKQRWQSRIISENATSY